MGLGEEAIGRLEGLDNLGGPGGRVDGDDLALGERVGVDFVAAVVLCAVGRVIEERDDFFVAVAGEEACMVLEAECDVGTKLKVGLQAAQAPDDLAGGAVDLVNGTGVASGDQVVTVGISVNGVDVEVVPRIGGVPSRTSLSRVQGEDSLCSLLVKDENLREDGVRNTIRRNMIQTRPLEE